MRLLIVTQSVDSEDSILGFFVRWIAEFAKHAEHIEIICLKSGRFDFPENVRVHSLGKEQDAARNTTMYRSVSRRVRYALRFLSLIWKLRREYDAVFVHMNPEYVILGGLFWGTWGKRIALWYTHKSVDLKLRIAEMLVHTVFTASKESFRLRSAKLHVMGHGIDTDFFSPDMHVARTTAALSLGRLSPTKRNDLIIRAAVEFPNDLWIAGEGPERQKLERLARELSIAPRVQFLGARTQEGARDAYRTAGVFAHASETGSLDKVVLEALACGLPVVTTAATLADLPVTVVPPTPQAIAEGVRTAGHADGEQLAAFVREHHSLQKLVPAILSLI